MLLLRNRVRRLQLLASHRQGVIRSQLQCLRPQVELKKHRVLKVLAKLNRLVELRHFRPQLHNRLANFGVAVRLKLSLLLICPVQRIHLASLLHQVFHLRNLQVFQELAR